MPINRAGLELPKAPGVYLFKQQNGGVLYVGKATDLNTRVRSYFAKNPDRMMIPQLIDKADDVEVIVTNNPNDALLLERQLIREHKPRYNSLLKDDKSFPFITITNEEIPRILYTRHPPHDAKKWGPFPDIKAAKKVLQLFRRHFGIRDCKEMLPQGCLSMHIGLCTAPCIDTQGYAKRINAAIDVLNGNATELIDSLVEEMKLQSDELQYEQAANTRDMITSVQTTLRQQVISSRFYQDCDALGFAERGDLAIITVLHAKKGTVQAQESWPLIHRGDTGETVVRFITEHYAEHRPPRLLLTPTPIGEWLEGWLQDRRGSVVEVRIPHKGDLATLRKLADQNAEVQVERHQNKQSGSLEQRAADAAAALLGLESLDYIVCFDMAQIQGEHRVGASIALKNGRPHKKSYRTYQIRGDSIDDLRMMGEVVERWLKKQDQWPDLLLLDGGETHLNMVKKILDKHGVIDRFELAALAKKKETLYRIDRDPIVLGKMGRAIVHARDEAHRFVNRFHRKRRGKATLRDPLEGIQGLGAKKLQSILRHFGGRKGIEHADVEQLSTAPGIGPALATRIWNELHR